MRYTHAHDVNASVPRVADADRREGNRTVIGGSVLDRGTSVASDSGWATCRLPCRVQESWCRRPVAATFPRGLLPRSVADQAVATGICTAAIYQTTVTAHSAAETLALFTTGTHGMRGREPDPTRLMVVDLAFAATGALIDQALPAKPNEALPISITRFVGQTLMLGGAAGAVVAVVDQGLARLFPGRRLTRRPIAVDVLLGASVAGFSFFIRHQHAREFGLVDPKRRAIKRAGLIKTAKASVAGIEPLPEC